MKSERKWGIRPEDLLATEQVHQEVEAAALQEQDLISQEAEGGHQEAAHLEVIQEVDQEEGHLEVIQEVAQEVDNLGVDPEVEMKEGPSEEEVLPSEAVNDLFILLIN